jgi:hypothetical protein
VTKLVHKVPCAECPWRTASPAGWLGGHSPEYYADAVRANETPPCHLRDHGPDHPRSAFCVGALQTQANACIAPYNTPGAEAAKAVVGPNQQVFSHPATFYQHHAGKPYQHPLQRRGGGT